MADAVLSRGGKPAFAPLTDDLDRASPEARAACVAALTGIGKALAGPFLALVRHPSEEVRVRAIRVLATRPEPDARAAVVSALTDPEPSVQRTALASLSLAEDEGAILAVTKLAREDDAWAVRARATDALATLVSGPRARVAASVLAKISAEDPIPFVRESALRALGGSAEPAARAALGKAAKTDPEPRLRGLAESLLCHPGRKGAP